MACHFSRVTGKAEEQQMHFRETHPNQDLIKCMRTKEQCELLRLMYAGDAVN